MSDVSMARAPWWLNWIWLVLVWGMWAFSRKPTEPAVPIPADQTTGGRS